MYKTTNYCRLCLNKKIKIGLKLKSIPLGEKYTKKRKKLFKQKKYPISLGWCKKCKNVQTMEVVEPKILWSDFTYISGQTKQIVNHFKSISNIIINRFRLGPKDFFVDIGSNDGTFLKFFQKKKIRVLGIDPAKNVVRLAKKNDIPSITEFFNFKISKLIKKNNGKPKIIICFNTFAHSENIREMLAGIYNLLDEKGVFIFECQYLSDIYKKKILGTIFHEHMYHHSITSLNNFFNSYKMNLFAVKKVNIQKGSIVGFVCKNNLYPKTNYLKKMIILEKKNNDITFNKLLLFQKYINNQRDKSQKLLKKFNGELIGAIGAARSGPTYAFNYGLDKYIKVLFDDHPLKKNKFSGFNQLRVFPTNKIFLLKPKVLIVLAYLHLKKIIIKHKNYLKTGGNFMSVYPEIKLINYKNYKKIIK